MGYVNKQRLHTAKGWENDFTSNFVTISIISLIGTVAWDAVGLPLLKECIQSQKSTPPKSSLLMKGSGIWT